MKITYTEDDMEMLRSEIRYLSKERSDMRLVLQVRDKALAQVTKELKRTKKLASHLQRRLSELENGDSSQAIHESPAGEGVPMDANAAGQPATQSSTPQENDVFSAEEPSEGSLEVNSKDLKEAMENLSLVESSVEEVDEHHQSGGTSSDEQSNQDDAQTPGSAEEIRKRAERMLVWANSATNRNEVIEKQQIPQTISLSKSTTPSGTYSVNSSSDAGSKRLYRNVPNDAVLKKKGPLSGIRRFLEDQIVRDSKEDTYLDSESESDYYSDDALSEDSSRHGVRNNIMAS